MDAGVAIRPLYRVILMVAVPTVNLNTLINDVIQHLRSKNLNETALRCKLLSGLEQRIAGENPILDYACDAVAHRFGREDSYGHLGELVLDHAKLSNALPKRLSLLRVFQRLP